MHLDTKDAAAARIVFDPDTSAMRIHDGLADRKTQPYALACSSFSPAEDLVELHEYALFVIVWNSIPPVRHRNGGGGRSRGMIMAHLDANRRILWREFQGVVHDVADHLDHAIRIADHGNARRIAAQR